MKETASILPASQDRPLPATAEAKALLGCLILDPARIPEAVTAGIKPVHFDDLRDAVVFRTLVEMHADGKAIDIITLAGRLKTRPGFTYEIIPYLTALQDATPSAANLSAYFEPVIDAYRRLALWRHAGELQRQACNTSIDSKSIAEDSENLVRAICGDDASELPSILDASCFVAQHLPEPKQVIHSLLHQGSKLALGGGSKSFKTWCLLDLALSVCAGAAWMNFKTTAGKVLFVNFEIQDFSFQQRIRAVFEAKKILLADGQLFLLNLRGRASSYDILIPQIVRLAKAHNFALIILDPVYKLYGGADENSAGDVAGLLNAFESLAVKTGAAVAFGCHFSKGNQAGKESIDRISGSGVFARDPDSLLVMTKHEQEGAFAIEATLRNFPQVEPFVVSWEYPLMRPNASLDPEKLKQIGGRKKEFSASQALEVLPARGLSNQDWQTEVESEHGISRRTFYNLRKELQETGKVIHSKINNLWQPVRKQ